MISYPFPVQRVHTYREGTWVRFPFHFSDTQPGGGVGGRGGGEGRGGRWGCNGCCCWNGRRFCDPVNFAPSVVEL